MRTRRRSKLSVSEERDAWYYLMPTRYPLYPSAALGADDVGQKQASPEFCILTRRGVMQSELKLTPECALAHDSRSSATGESDSAVSGAVATVTWLLILNSSGVATALRALAASPAGPVRTRRKPLRQVNRFTDFFRKMLIFVKI
ncbi:hypothetical protein EVAR_86131_1 [Eumeta japonica]|uniref:Uncharacterized protein n=1 Tax=Eumeta variegata TaxID=151549 RepID=A0A4C1V0L1_EUMVA|nr:hypothetical protein EVAR_86131_1 [Eumeta japonica]